MSFFSSSLCAHFIQVAIGDVSVHRRSGNVERVKIEQFNPKDLALALKIANATKKSPHNEMIKTRKDVVWAQDIIKRSARVNVFTMDSVQTSNNSFAQVFFDDNTSISLASNTTLRIVNDKDGVLQIRISRGSFRIIAKSPIRVQMRSMKLLLSSGESVGIIKNAKDAIIAIDAIIRLNDFVLSNGEASICVMGKSPIRVDGSTLSLDIFDTLPNVYMQQKEPQDGVYSYERIDK